MKKIRYLGIVLVLLSFGPVICVEADQVGTEVGVEFLNDGPPAPPLELPRDRDDGHHSLEKVSKSQKYLPQTGEQKQKIMGSLGLLILVLVSYFYQKNKKTNKDGQ